MRRWIALVGAVALICALGVQAPVAAAAGTKTVIVSPSGGNDTAGIQAAFDACAGRPGCTVRFTAGHFFTNSVAVRHFAGFVTGAGQGKTVIDSLRGLDPSLPGVTLTQFDPGDPTTLFPVPVLLGFDGGSVSMSNLTFDITAAEPAETWYLDYSAWTDLRVTVLVTGNTSSTFDRVTFVGHAGSSWGVNNVHPICICGMRQLDEAGGDWSVIQPTRGNHAITRSTFEGVNNAIVVQQLTDGKLTVGGNASRGNFFDAAIAFNPSDNPNSDVEFSYNDIDTYYFGAWIEDWEAVAGGQHPARPGRYAISHNTIHVGDWANGVVLADIGRAPGTAATFVATVADNTIILDAANSAGIFGYNSRNAIIRDNAISGVGPLGIYAGTSCDPGSGCDEVTGWLILSNNVQKMTAASAPIWLGPGTSHCTVVGTNLQTTVQDDGTGNVLIDVTRHSGPHPKLLPWPWKGAPRL